MNNEINNEVNNTGTTVDQTSTPVENVTPVEPVPTTEVPVAETTPEVAPVQTETVPVESTPVAPVEATPTPVEQVAETPAPETPAEPRLVQIKPNIGGGSLTPDSSNGNINVVAKKQSIVPVIVLIVGIIGLAISGYWLYNELNHKDEAKKTQLEKLPFSGAFNPIVTTPTTIPTTTTPTETNPDEKVTTGIVTYPDFTGKTVEEASKWCNDNQIEMQVAYITEEGAEAGTIVRQSGVVGANANTAETFIVYIAN